MTTPTSTLSSTATLEQCLLGEQSYIFQQQLYQNNYIQWFQQQEEEDVINIPVKDNHNETTAANTELVDDHNNAMSLPTTDEKTNDNHTPSLITSLTTNTSDLLQDFAPVSSKWSDCSDDNMNNINHDPVSSSPPPPQQNHVIDLVLLRKLVAAGYGLDDNDDHDDDDDTINDDDINDNDQIGNSSRRRRQPQSSSDGDISSMNATTTVRPSRISKMKKGYRAIAWRVLLGFLPLDTHQWLLHITTNNTNDENENIEKHDDDNDDDIKEVTSNGIATVNNISNNNTDSKMMVQQRRELYISLVQELFVSVEDVTTIRAMELCGRNNNNKKNHFYQHGRRPVCKDNDTSMSSNISRTSSSSSLFSMNDTTGIDTSMHRNTSNTSDTAADKDSIELARASVVSEQLQQYWKEKSLDPFILERCCVTNHSNTQSSTNLNVLRIQNDDHYWNTNRATNESNIATATNTTTDEDSINIIKQDNLQDFVDNVLLLDEIRKDVIRTHPDLAFFLDPTIGLRRYAAIERILFVWSKYNKGVRYVQGMNEIVGILYYVLANDQNDEWSIWAEADTFWLFNALIGGDDMRDVFISGFDEHDTGIHGRLITMQQLLQRHDPEVSEHLQELGVEVSFYAIRWWTTLLCREFLLPDTIRLWDSMFASTHKDNFLRYVCAIMVMSIRDRLLKGDFTVCLQLLHDFPSTSVDHLLEASRALWIYESQISVACHRGGLTLHQALTTIESPKALIMAFGFVNGTPPPPASILKNPLVDDIKTASVQIEATVRRSATMFLGRAKGWYNRYNNNNKSDDNKDRANNTSTTPTEEDIQHDDPAELINEEDDVYMKAFLDS